MKCTLPPNTLHQEGIPLNKVWLRVTSPSMQPFAWDTSSHMGGRPKYPATPHAKGGWSSKSAATLPEGGLGEGEGGATPTPVATTPCSAAANTWNMASERPSVANLGAGGAAVG